MRHLIALLVAVLFVLPTQARPTIELKNRKENNHKPLPGICWWTCAQMIGNQYGIKPLQTICQQVTKTGIGYKSGAGAQEIDHWTKKLKVMPRVCYQDKSDEGIKFLKTWTRKDLPAIASIDVWKQEKNGTWTAYGHAVLVMDITKEDHEWSDGTTDKSVTILDPNTPWAEIEWPLAYFRQVWRGTAYVFDPAEQEK